jgi:hypothetical protein
VMIHLDSDFINIKTLKQHIVFQVEYSGRY